MFLKLSLETRIFTRKITVFGRASISTTCHPRPSGGSTDKLRIEQESFMLRGTSMQGPLPDELNSRIKFCSIVGRVRKVAQNDFVCYFVIRSCIDGTPGCSMSSFLVSEMTYSFPYRRSHRFLNGQTSLCLKIAPSSGVRGNQILVAVIVPSKGLNDVFDTLL